MIISYNDMNRFVATVVGGCVADGEYIPETRALLTRLETVLYFTDYKLKSDKNNVDELCRELYGDEVCALIDGIDSAQYDDILIAIDEKIEALSSKNKLYSKVCEFVEKLSESMGKASDVLARLDTGEIKKLLEGDTNEASEKLGRA